MLLDTAHEFLVLCHIIVVIIINNNIIIIFILLMKLR